jgi:hypothetical protein
MRGRMSRRRSRIERPDRNGEAVPAPQPSVLRRPLADPDHAALVALAVTHPKLTRAGANDRFRPASAPPTSRRRATRHAEYLPTDGRSPARGATPRGSANDESSASISLHAGTGEGCRRVRRVRANSTALRSHQHANPPGRQSTTSLESSDANARRSHALPQTPPDPHDLQQHGPAPVGANPHPLASIKRFWLVEFAAGGCSHPTTSWPAHPLPPPSTRVCAIGREATAG